MLGVIPQLQPRMTRDNTLVRTKRLSKEVEQRRLPAAVQPDDADAVAEVDG